MAVPINIQYIVATLSQ